MHVLDVRITYSVKEIDKLFCGFRLNSFGSMIRRLDSDNLQTDNKYRTGTSLYIAWNVLKRYQIKMGR